MFQVPLVITKHSGEVGKTSYATNQQLKERVESCSRLVLPSEQSHNGKTAQSKKNTGSKNPKTCKGTSKKSLNANTSSSVSVKSAGGTLLTLEPRDL